MIRFAVVALLVAYPLLVWFGLARWGAPVLLGMLLGLLGMRLIVTAKPERRRLALALGSVMIAGGLAAALTDTGDETSLRWYPVMASVFMSGVFTASLFSGRPLIERLARLREPDLPPEAIPYTRRLTVTWAGLTLANAFVAAWTALFADLETWALYNGFLSYLLLGGFFCAEWLYRQRRRAEA